MTARKYRAPYTRKPDPGVLAADALYDQALRLQPPKAPVDCDLCGEPMPFGWCGECGGS